MKKLISSVIILILIFCCAVPCLAADTTLTNEKRTASMEVSAQYICIYEEQDGYTVADGEGGVYTAVTDSGLKIIVRTGEQGDYRLVVHEITEQDKAAAAWFKALFAGSKNIAPLDIFLIDENGNRFELPADAEITLEGLKGDQYVVGLSGGRKNRIAAAVANGKITFKAVGSDYYVVVTPAAQSDQPQTGDMALPLLWLSMMLASFLGLALAIKAYSKKEG